MSAPALIQIIMAHLSLQPTTIINHSNTLIKIFFIISSHNRCSIEKYRKAILIIFAILTGEQLWWSIYFIKKRLQHRYAPVNLLNFSEHFSRRTPPDNCFYFMDTGAIAPTILLILSQKLLILTLFTATPNIMLNLLILTLFTATPNIMLNTFFSSSHYCIMSTNLFLAIFSIFTF